MYGRGRAVSALRVRVSLLQELLWRRLCTWRLAASFAQ